MSEIIDFQSRRRDHLRHRATKCAENVGNHMARLEWLKHIGAPLADVVRASLDASHARRAWREITHGLASEAPENLHS